MIQRDWLSKTLAGALLGLTLAFACSVVFAHFAAGLAPPLRAQLAMWMVMPIWLSVLSGVYLLESGKQAWWWLILANLLVAALLACARFLL